jgi:hypothetical protein
MNLSDVAEEIAARLDTISGLNAFPFPPDSLTPPAAIVLNPQPGDVVYDQTYGRGMDRITLPVIVLGGRSSDQQAHADIRAYLDGSGARSVKAVLEAGTYTSLHTIRVTTGGVDGVKLGGVEYYAAMFDLDITGQGD